MIYALYDRRGRADIYTMLCRFCFNSPAIQHQVRQIHAPLSRRPYFPVDPGELDPHYNLSCMRCHGTVYRNGEPV